MCCSVLQRVAEHYSAYDHVYSHDIAVCCIVLQCVAVCCSVLQCVAVCCSAYDHVYPHDSLNLVCVARLCSVLQCVAVSFSVLQCVTACCSAYDCVACLIEFGKYLYHKNTLNVALYSQDTLNEDRLFYRALLQKRPII